MKHGVRKQKNWAAGPAHAQIGRPSDYDQYDIPTLQHRISEGHRAATHYETLAKDPSTHPDTKKMLTAAAKKTREQNEMFKERLRRKQAQA